ncbi:hypothetical protein [Sporisorium scitamineum]|uniref:Effector family protein Eff1 n=1 Tax=Sporisorium scitamineum TaxID=49012 RepID=A0A0F7SB16_9BASI|nr:hypothetical protein [Sporisorium scitamineum]
MLSQWAFALLFIINHVAQVGSRPTGHHDDWQVGNVPTSGPDSASLWNAPPYTSKDFTSPEHWHNTWLESQPVHNHGNAHELHSVWWQSYHPAAEHATEPAAVAAPKTPMHEDDLAHSTFEAETFSQEQWPAAVSESHGHLDPAVEAAPSSGPPSAHTSLDQNKVRHANPVSMTSTPRQKMRKLASIMNEPTRLSLLDEYVAEKAAWIQRIQTTFQSGELQLVSAKGSSTKPLPDSLWIAQGGQAARSFPPSGSTPPAAAVRWEHRSGSNGLSKSSGRSATSKQRKGTSLPKNQERRVQDERFYVYLNSPENMARLNREYFNNQLRILHINPGELQWEALNRMHLGSRVSYVLPPASKDDLSLIVDRHVGFRLGPDSFMTKLTGESQLGHLVSLWSPVLYDGGHSTMVLYGMGELAQQEKIGMFQRELKAKMHSAFGQKGSIPYAYQLAEEIH